MGRAIDITIVDWHAVIHIEGALVAQALGLDVDTFRQRMDNKQISQLCERGTGEDLGLFRTTFYYQGKRARFVVDRDGNVIEMPKSPDGN